MDISKLVLNENGGINSYYCKFIDKDEHIGVLHHTLLYPVETAKGRLIEKFFNSDIVKFIFLITQYASGKMTTNEKLVANTITIPPEEEKDYYKFFGIEDQKKYIEDALSNYYKKQTKPLKESKETTVKPIAAAAAANDTDDDATDTDDTDTDDEAEAPVRHFGPGYGHDMHVSVEPKKKGKKNTEKKEKREKKPSSSATKKMTQVASKSAKADAAAAKPAKKGKAAAGSKNAKSSIKANAGGGGRGSKRNRRTIKKRKRNIE